MKKIMILIMMVIMMTSTVFAAHNGPRFELDEDERLSEADEIELEEALEEDIESRDDLSDSFPELRREGKQIKESKVVGLENALIRVGNNSAAARIELNLMKITRERTREMAQLSELIIEEDEFNTEIIKALGKGKAKFLGLIDVEKIYRYKINEETGETIRSRSIIDLLAWDDLEEENN